jgi:2-hydroxy-3-keto-5-methylthiopentenyl-1-phosphate phosphatase
MAVNVKEILDKMKKEIKSIHGVMSPLGPIDLKGKRINIDKVIKAWIEYLKTMGVEYVLALDRDGIIAYILEYISDKIEDIKNIDMRDIAIINGKVHKVHKYWIMYISREMGLWLDIPPNMNEEEVYK